MRERGSLEREVERLAPGVPAERESGGSAGTAREPDPLVAPCRWVCHLQVEEKHGSNWVKKEPATGVLIGPRHVLTAAHVLDPYYKSVSAGRAQVVVQPAFSRDRSLGSYIGSDLRVSKGWQAGRKDAIDAGAYDYGMIVLASDAISTESHGAIGNEPLGYWGHPSRGQRTVFVPMPATFVENRVAICAGYPRATKRALWVGSGTLSNVVQRTGDRIIRTMRGMNNSALDALGDKAKGASGGPVWLQVGAVRYLVGSNVDVQAIQHVDHKTGATTRVWRGHAARLTIEMFEELTGWMQAAP